MTVTSFHANCVAIEDHEEFCLVGFAEQEFGTTRYLQFQRSHVNDPQDQALEMDTYYVERDDQRNSCYGGIERCDLYADLIMFSFNDVGTRNLDLMGPMRISYDIDEKTLKDLRDRLESVFAGTTCLVDHTKE